MWINWLLSALYSMTVETKRSLVASKKLGILCDWLKQEGKMKSKVGQFALAAILVVGSAGPALAQNIDWKLNSDHSAGRLSIASTTDPNAVFDAGIATRDGIRSLECELACEFLV